jgi:hypothetical protein
MNPTNDREAHLAMAYINARLEDPRVEEHFTKDRHKQAATRALLDLLDVPLPSWAERSISGRASVTKAGMERFRQDNPQERIPRQYTPKSP